jgi:hypothetical protein
MRYSAMRLFVNVIFWIDPRRLDSRSHDRWWWSRAGPHLLRRLPYRRPRVSLIDPPPLPDVLNCFAVTSRHGTRPRRTGGIFRSVSEFFRHRRSGIFSVYPFAVLLRLRTPASNDRGPSLEVPQIPGRVLLATRFDLGIDRVAIQVVQLLNPPFSVLFQ